MSSTHLQRSSELSISAPLDANWPVVYILEKSEGIGSSLAFLLSSSGFEVEVFATPEELLLRLLAQTGHPSCIAVDSVCFGTLGLRLHRELAARGIHLPFVLFTMESGRLDATAILAPGALRASVPAGPEELLDSVRKALAMSEVTSGQLIERDQLLERYASLTPAERQIMKRIAAGDSIAAIAERRRTSRNTVQNQRGRILKKMRARSVGDLVRMHHLLFDSGAAVGEK